MIEVLATGPLATIQDRGRAGWAHLGVPISGAADRESHRLANALVGNSPEAATIEVTLGGLAIRTDATVLVALTGALCPTSSDGGPTAYAAPFHLPAGSALRMGTPAAGLRTYVAVSGGMEVPAVLGSRATDTLSGLGPAPLRVGDQVAVGDAGGAPLADLAPVTPPKDQPLELRVLPGPRSDWLAEPPVGTTWRVSGRSDRVGVRLEGTPLGRLRQFTGVELPSEGVVRGAVQLPAGGLPVVFLADHPVTGGYPVVGVLDDRSVDVLAQARPGQMVRLLG